MPKKNTVAICFYGLTRSLKYTVESINKNIFQILKNNNFDYDIYLHTYDLDILTNPRSGEDNCLLDKNEYKLLNPNYYLITNQSEFKNTINIQDYLKKGDPWGEEHHTSLYNLLCQLNSIKLVNDLCNKTKEYKCYIYLRPDLLYVDKISLYAINHVINNYNDKILFTPMWGKWGGLNDRFCIGTKSAIDIVMKRLDYIKSFSRIKPPHSEKYLFNVVSTNNITKLFFKTRAIRVRSNGNQDEQDIYLYITKNIMK